MNTAFLKLGVRVWLIETIVSGFNFFVLMGLFYEPLWGELEAHQIGMSTRILYIFVFAYFMLRYAKKYETKDLVIVGFLWLGLELLFEWAEVWQWVVQFRRFSWVGTYSMGLCGLMSC